MSGKWFYKRREKEFGPVSFFELKQLVERGTLDEDAHVRKGPDGCWVYAGGIPGLFATAADNSPSGDGEATPATLPRFFRRWNDWRIAVPVAASLVLLVVLYLLFAGGSGNRRSRAAITRSIVRAPDQIQQPRTAEPRHRGAAVVVSPATDPVLELRVERIAQTLETQGLLALSADDLQFAYYGAGREALIDRLRAAASRAPPTDEPKSRWLHNTVSLLALSDDLTIELALEVQRLDAQAFEQLQRWLNQVGAKLQQPSQSLKAHEIQYAQRSPFLRRRYQEYQEARRQFRLGSSDASRNQ